MKRYLTLGLGGVAVIAQAEMDGSKILMEDFFMLLSI